MQIQSCEISASNVERYTPFHNQLISQDYELKRFYSRDGIEDIQDSVRDSCNGLSIGLIDIVLLPADLVIESLEGEGDSKNFYALYEKQNAIFNSRFTSRYRSKE